MPMLNLGILAHVDAGKTSLTERLLFAAGVIDEIGSVDQGSTQTDSSTVERRRGITVKAAVVSFAVGDVTVNLIDTPGHPDFIAEVERVLDVLDGAVLVVSAVEGVQAQTRLLLRALQRLGLPTLLFVNKIDRRGAQHEPLLESIRTRLTPAVVGMGSTDRLGTPDAGFRPYGADDPAHRAELVSLLTERDEAMLADYVADEAAVPFGRLQHELAAQTRAALVHPVYFGSAITGAGVAALVDGFSRLLPRAEQDEDGPLSGLVFKVDRGPGGERLAYVRVHRGRLRVRDKVPLPRGRRGRVTGIAVFEGGTAVERPSVGAGRIARVRGLVDVQIGDRIGPEPAAGGHHHFAPPTLETVVAPRRRHDRGALHTALTQLAEQDPLINLRQDDRQELYVSLYGEVQKQIVEETLHQDFGLDVTFRETTTLCVERPVGTGAAVELMAEEANPFLATVGLRVDPAPLEAGVRFALEVELGSMPRAFLRAIEDTVYATLGQGCFGWPVTDCSVTLTHGGYAPRQSHAHATFDKSMSSTGADFRHLTPLVLMRALGRAGTVVAEPVHRFRLEIPEDTLGQVLPVLARLRAVPDGPRLLGRTARLTGEVPAAAVSALQRQLPGLTRGEGWLESSFGRFEAVSGISPRRARSAPDALQRKDYLLQVERRMPRPADPG